MKCFIYYFQMTENTLDNHMLLSNIKRQPVDLNNHIVTILCPSFIGFDDGNGNGIVSQKSL